MADKTIGSLPQAAAVGDDSLFVMEQQGKAMKISGAQMLSFANVETAEQVQAASESAAAAAASERAASESAAAAADSATDAADSATDAQTAAATYPRIGGNGNWEVWNSQTGEYQDTGVSATGPAGPTGPTGPAGGVDSFNGRTGSVMPKAGDYTAADVGAAPDGYGLGGRSKILSSDDDINTIWENGWYLWGEDSPANAPDMSPGAGGPGHIIMRTFNYNSITLFQEYWSLNQLLQNKARRICRNGTWYPLEWVNPPMLLGVEYRTTERYNGKPVYAKLVNCGACPVGSAKNTVHGISDVDKVVRCYGQAFASDGTTISISGLYGGAADKRIDIWGSKYYVTVAQYTSDPTNGYTCYGCIYVTKTTD